MKKGFTLIELLAVIVILAIIALIATPIVLNIINDVKESAVIRSADFYIDALENEVMLENMKQGGNFNPNICEIKKVNNILGLYCDEKLINIKVDGEVPTSGSITFEEGKVKDVNLTYQNGTVTLNNKGELVLGESNTKACYLAKDEDNNNEVSTGDLITCSTESFHVISNDGTTISMLAQYNLDVGSILNNQTGEFKPIENPTGIQNENAKGFHESVEVAYGVIDFRNNSYWLTCNDMSNVCNYVVDTNYANEGREYPFIYGDYKDVEGNQQNLIYPHVKSYEEYLIGEGVTSAKATLISYEQLVKLGCDGENKTCINSQYPWVYTTTYWTGSASPLSEDSASNVVWGVILSGYLNNNYVYDAPNILGVRPVVNISVDEL